MSCRKHDKCPFTADGAVRVRGVVEGPGACYRFWLRTKNGRRTVCKSRANAVCLLKLRSNKVVFGSVDAPPIDLLHLIEVEIATTTPAPASYFWNGTGFYRGGNPADSEWAGIILLFPGGACPT